MNGSDAMGKGFNCQVSKNTFAPYYTGALRNDAIRAALSPLPRLRYASGKAAGSKIYPRRSIGSRTLGRSGDLPGDLPVDSRQCFAEPLFKQQR